MCVLELSGYSVFQKNATGKYQLHFLPLLFVVWVFLFVFVGKLCWAILFVLSNNAKENVVVVVVVVVLHLIQMTQLVTIFRSLSRSVFLQCKRITTWKKEKFTSLVALCSTTCSNRRKRARERERGNLFDAMHQLPLKTFKRHTRTGRFVSFRFLLCYLVVLCAHFFPSLFFFFCIALSSLVCFLLVLIETPWWSFTQ